MIEEANEEFDRESRTCQELDRLRPDFEACFETFADDNNVLLSLEVNNPDIYAWVKRTAEVFYCFGRGDQQRVDAATMMNHFPNGL